jgi:hypothetical protein
MRLHSRQHGLSIERKNDEAATRERRGKRRKEEGGGGGVGRPRAMPSKTLPVWKLKCQQNVHDVDIPSHVMDMTETA